MKIPDHIAIFNNGVLYGRWSKMAVKMSVEYGIFVEVGVEFRSISGVISRLYYKIDDHEFESLKDLRKALRNKVFM